MNRGYNLEVMSPHSQNSHLWLIHFSAFLLFHFQLNAEHFAWKTSKSGRFSPRQMLFFMEIFMHLMTVWWDALRLVPSFDFTGSADHSERKLKQRRHIISVMRKLITCLYWYFRSSSASISTLWPQTEHYKVKKCLKELFLSIRDGKTRLFLYNTSIRHYFGAAV